MGEFLCRIAKSDHELAACLRIRHQVFVEELRIFNDTDLDGLEDRAIHIVGRVGDAVGGCVRVHEESPGVWCGSRLAVRRPWRGRLSRPLVEAAVEVVNGRGASRFYAHVLVERAPFFLRCGWRKKGGVVEHHGLPHIVMEAPL